MSETIRYLYSQGGLPKGVKSMGYDDFDSLKELIELANERKYNYSQLYEYVFCKSDRKDFQEILEQESNKRFLKSLLRTVNYGKAKERNQQIEQWMIENNYSLADALEKIPEEKPEWSGIFTSPKSLIVLRRREQERLSKKAKEGIPKTGKSKPVICIDNGIEFTSINKAAEYFNVRSQDVSDCCYGVIKSIDGKHFKFL